MSSISIHRTEVVYRTVSCVDCTNHFLFGYDSDELPNWNIIQIYAEIKAPGKCKIKSTSSASVGTSQLPQFYWQTSFNGTRSLILASKPLTPTWTVDGWRVSQSCSQWTKPTAWTSVENTIFFDDVYNPVKTVTVY